MALEFARQNPSASVEIVDCGASEHSETESGVVAALSNASLRRAHFPSTASSVFGSLTTKGRMHFARAMYRMNKRLKVSAFSPRADALYAVLSQRDADAYFVFSIDALLPAVICAARRGRSVVFDSMEYFADMGDGQSDVERKLARDVQAKHLKGCALVLASTKVLAKRLEEEYGIGDVLPFYNCPPVGQLAPATIATGLRLYWRNSVVALSQRGLDVVLRSMTSMPSDILLSVRGKPSRDGGGAVHARVKELGLEGRVDILPAHDVEEGVSAASGHHIGLCPEIPGPLNQALTASNKIFDFMAARLAVVAADLPGLRDVVETARCGLLFEPNNPADLRRNIMALYSNREYLTEVSQKGFDFFLNEGNFQVQFSKFMNALREKIDWVG